MTITQLVPVNYDRFTVTQPEATTSFVLYRIFFDFTKLGILIRLSICKLYPTTVLIVMSIINFVNEQYSVQTSRNIMA